MTVDPIAIYGAAALAAGAIVRALKSDAIPINIPVQWRPSLVVAIAAVGGGFAAAAAGAPAREAILGGLAGGALAIVGHAVGIEWLRDGREIGEPKDPK